MKNENTQGFFKKHADAATTIGVILSVFGWMNVKFSEVDKRIGVLEKDITIIKTIMLMDNHHPKELASSKKEIRHENKTNK